MNRFFAILQNSPAYALAYIALFTGLLVGCSSNDSSTLSYKAYNHTSTPIASIVINNEGGVLNAPAHSETGEACCVVVPNEWRPGLKVSIKWEEDGGWLKDANGQLVLRNGQTVYVKMPYKEQIVELQKYERNGYSSFRIHFFPNDMVKVTMLPYGPGHVDYPYPVP